MSASQDQVVSSSVANEVSDTPSPPSKRQKEDEEPMVENVVPMVAPLSLWTVPDSNESRHCINDVRGYEEMYFKDALELAKKNGYKIIKVSIGGCASVTKIRGQREVKPLFGSC